MIDWASAAQQSPSRWRREAAGQYGCSREPQSWATVRVMTTVADDGKTYQRTVASDEKVLVTTPVLRRTGLMAAPTGAEAIVPLITREAAA